MIQIWELLPNPKGKDSGNEWIRLYNDGPAQSVSGFSVKDASGKKYNLSGTIGGNQALTIKDTQSKIILNNSNETVYLYDTSGKLIDTCSYPTAGDDEIIRCHIQAVAKTTTTSASVIENLDPAGEYRNIAGGISARDVFGGILVSLILAVIFWIAYKEIKVSVKNEKLD